MSGAFAQFTDNENTTTLATTTVHREIVYVNPLSEKSKIIIGILVMACLVSIPLMVFFTCIHKLTITEDRVRLPLYEENENYSINTTNPAFEGPQPLPPPPSYLVDSEI